MRINYPGDMRDHAKANGLTLATIDIGGRFIFQFPLTTEQADALEKAAWEIQSMRLPPEEVASLKAVAVPQKPALSPREAAERLSAHFYQTGQFDTRG